MNTDDLTRALRDATDDIEPRSSFTTDVLKGGRRRQNRHRVAIATGMAALLGVTGSAVWALSPDQSSPPGQNQDTGILAAPTKGDLAGDQEYLAKVIQAWQRGLEVSPNKDARPDRKLTGSPKVLWAGTTPLGRAAIVGQAGEEVGTGTVHYPEGAKRELLYPAFGLVTGDEPTLVNEAPVLTAGVPAFLFGPGDRQLITLDRGPQLFVSTWSVGDDGKGEREWQQIPAADGAATMGLPDGIEPRTVRVVEGPDPAKGTRRTVLPSSTYAEGWDRQGKPIASRTLDWAQEPVRIQGAARDPLVESHDLMAEQGMADPLEMGQVSGFQVIGALPNGRFAIGFEYVPDFDGSRFYVLVTERSDKIHSLTHAGKLNKDTVLPARAKLPEDQGWLVADYGASLRYRTTQDGPWTEAGNDAALLPANATQVEVTKAGKPEVVTL